MFIHPWDAAVDAAEWRDWLASTDRFGVLAVPHLEAAGAPVLVPTHFTLSDDHLLIHLARPNPVWPHLQAASLVRLAIFGDYAYIPGYWRARPDQPAEEGVPTSYYTAVQFECRPTIIDEPTEKAALIAEQLADFQPEGGHAPMTAADPPYARMLAGVRGLRLDIANVEAKFKYDDHKPVEHRTRVSDELQRRGHGLDGSTAAQQRRRTAALGEWRG